MKTLALITLIVTAITCNSVLASDAPCQHSEYDATPEVISCVEVNPGTNGKLYVNGFNKTRDILATMTIIIDKHGDDEVLTYFVQPADVNTRLEYLAVDVKNKKVLVNQFSSKTNAYGLAMMSQLGNGEAIAKLVDSDNSCSVAPYAWGGVALGGALTGIGGVIFLFPATYHTIKCLNR
ncbi:MAG: hypothetical protein AABY53_04375 [Bdellovibrionota bacterium]